MEVPNSDRKVAAKVWFSLSNNNCEIGGRMCELKDELVQPATDRSKYSVGLRTVTLPKVIHKVMA